MSWEWNSSKAERDLEMQLDDLYENLLKQKQQDIYRLQRHATGQGQGGIQQQAKWNALYSRYLKRLDETQARINHMEGVK
tara:strand:+ start:151 stop:390 length:240 start_codon:yes stop_codon:yes gene_type:complete